MRETKLLSKIGAALAALALTTILYTEWMYQSDKTDRSVIREKITAAFQDGALLFYGYPHLKNPYSRDNLSGLDQGAECFYVHMIMFREKLKKRINGLNPGYYSSGGGEFNCIAAHTLVQSSATQLEDPSQWQIAHKPRLWHGVKAALLSALPSLQYAQLTWLIQLTTFFGFALFSMLVVATNRQVGFAYLPFVFSAYYCSSILFFGGVVYAIPLMAMVLWGVVWLAYRMIVGTKRRTAEIFIITAGGTLHSFFFQMDGAEIYAFSLIFFVEIFLSPEGPSRQSLHNAIESCIFYTVGFVGSTVCKNILVALLSGSFAPLSELLTNIATRSRSATDSGREIGLFEIVGGQFHWYGIAGYMVAFLHQFVDISRYLVLPLILLTVFFLSTYKKRNLKEEFDCVGFGLCGFVLMLAAVIGRYMVLRQHSDVHVFFVNRYLFVFAGTVYFYTLWLAITVMKYARLRQQLATAVTR